MIARSRRRRPTAGARVVRRCVNCGDAAGISVEALNSCSILLSFPQLQLKFGTPARVKEI